MVRSGVLVLFPLVLFGQTLTPVPNGPYRVAGNRILDRQDRPYLIRGTQLATLTAMEPADVGAASAFGPLSATTLITIRQRLNMNAVRLPILPEEYIGAERYRSRVDGVLRLANQLELLVILEASERPWDPDAFWTQLASRFMNCPNVFFAPLTGPLARVVRKAGATQPVIVRDSETVSAAEPNVIFEVTPSLGALKTESDRRRRFAVAGAVAVVVNGLDPQFEQVGEDCAALPADPAEATSLIQGNLKYFDAQHISWTLSSFTPGKLITDYRYFNGTKLDPGWTCGQPAEAGIGMVLLAHLWNATPLGLLTVSESRGGLAIARGAIATAYGPILADDDIHAPGLPLPTRLGNISVRITDSRGVARLAPLLHAGAGWGFLNFITPDECANGPAEVAIVRTDGSVSKSRVLIADMAPAIFSAPPDGRSIAFGEVTQHVPGKKDTTFPAWKCGDGGCQSTPIALSPEVFTTLRLLGTGFRHAGEHPDVRVTAGGVAVPVLSIGRGPGPGNDQLTVRLPDALAGLGEIDLRFTINGELSNVVRIRCGSVE